MRLTSRFEEAVILALRLHAKQLLRTTVCKPETGPDFIHDQENPVLMRELSEMFDV